jgi:hypothetical protein
MEKIKHILKWSSNNSSFVTTMVLFGRKPNKVDQKRLNSVDSEERIEK